MSITRRHKIMIGAATLVCAAGAVAGTSVASAGGGDDDAEAPITGSALETASAAALDHTGEGRVTDTEVGDEESLYEIEVTLDDGSEVDVQLDADFKIVGAEAGDPAEERGDNGD